MTGGSKKQEAANFIGRDREIATLKTELENLNQTLKEKATLLEQLQKDYEQIKFQINKLFGEKNTAEIDYAKENERLTSFEDNLSTRNSRIIE